MGLTAALAYKALIVTGRSRDLNGWRGRAWRGSYRRAITRWGEDDVRVVLHGQSAILNFGNPYPLFVRGFPSYNAPLVEAVAIAHESLGRQVTVVDVGAGSGDTALLLHSRCGPLMEQLVCVEGEAAFAALLRHNVAGIAAVCEAFLSDEHGVGRNLVRAGHAGTAAALGAEESPTTTLDELLDLARVDVLKIDTDGYDGRVLAGASKTLCENEPLVLFEWHPLACRAAGTDYRQAFQVLESAGYDRFVFFDKYGRFNHFRLRVDETELDLLARFCLETKSRTDWHYDVLAFPAPWKVDLVRVADLRYWGIRRPPDKMSRRHMRWPQWLANSEPRAARLPTIRRD